MSAKWCETERFLVQALNEMFGHLARFELCGGSNSGVSDIRVIPRNGIDCFYIEAKSPKSRGGQFVAAPDRENKKLAPVVGASCSALTLDLLSYVNGQVSFKFDGEDENYSKIPAPGDLLAQRWMTEHYQDKNVKFVVVPDIDMPGGIRLISLEPGCLDAAFEFAVQCYRKRSGSSHLPKCWTAAAIEKCGNEWADMGTDFYEDEIITSEGNVYHCLFMSVGESVAGVLNKKVARITDEDEDEVEIVLSWNEERECYEVKKRSKLPENFTVMPGLSLRKNCCVDSSPKLVEVLS